MKLRRSKRWVSRAIVALMTVLLGITVLALIFQLHFYLKTKQYYSQFDNSFGEPVFLVPDPLNLNDLLTTQGTEIVNQSGEEVVLEGVNLGGWLLQEYWMCPIVGNPEIHQWTHQETLQVLEERFGFEKSQKLMEIYQDNWITEWDIQKLASMGVNVLRVPFWYRNFMSDPEGTWLTENMEDNPGFQKLDWVIETAGKYGIYVILDMHGCPGGQSYDHCTGTARQCELFNNEAYQTVMEQLWVKIAKRYAGNPVVAAYDIMNEPRKFDTDVSSDPRNLLYDRMIKAIRSVDSEHMITVEAMWSISVLPDPAELGWENVIYQTHPYGNTDPEDYCEKMVAYGVEHNVPIYIGEFSDMSMLEACRKYQLSYTAWTYKGTGDADGTWYMYQNYQLKPVNVFMDPYWLMKMKWGPCLATQYFEENEAVTSHWR